MSEDIKGYKGDQDIDYLLKYINESPEDVKCKKKMKPQKKKNGKPTVLENTVHSMTIR